MTQIKIAAGGQIYTVSPDDEPPVGAHLWALLSARVIDEITSEPPRQTITIKSDDPGLISRVGDDGVVGLVGIPRNVFPNLTAQNYTLHMIVEAERYVPRDENVTIPMTIGFPSIFAVTDIGNIPLHREPVIIRGRTVRVSGITTTPISGATITITGLWRTLPPANVAVPADPPNLISLLPPLYFSRVALAGNLRQRNVIPVVGQDKHLYGQSFQGSKSLRLTDSTNLNPGDIIMIDFSDPYLLEYLVINTIVGASTPDQPADINLIYPLAHTHRNNSVVRKVTLQAPGPNNPFAQDVLIGDSCVFLTSMIGLSTNDVTEITGGGNPAEYHMVSRFSVVSDIDGFFELPPLSRVAQVEIEANDGGGPPQIITRIFSPDYPYAENFLDFIFQ